MHLVLPPPPIMTYMRRAATSGLWSGNEMFAMKKNVAEDMKLKKTITCLSMDESYEKHAAERDIRGTRLFLKDVRLSTGHSKEGICSGESAPPSGHLSIISYDVPDRLLQRSERSFSLRPRGSVIYEINEAVNNDKLPSITSATLAPQATRLNRNRALTVGGIQSDTPRLQNTRRTKSEGAPSKYLSVNDLPRGSTKLSVFTDGTDNDSDAESIDEEQERLQEFLRLNTRYNPWNIQQGNGDLYDALEPPRIKDCYRPVCSLTCSTCMSRKQCAPCFVIPGITHPSGFVLPLKSVPSKTKKTKKKDKSKTSTRSPTAKNNECLSTSADDCVSQAESHESKVTKDEMEDKLQLRVQQELKFLLKSEKKINMDRLNKLSIPKGGFKREVRFSKSIIKREVKKLTLKKAAEALSEVETENRRKINSRVNMFLAMTNSQENHIPAAMVHIPIREDIMHVDISHIQQVDLDLITQHKIGKRKVGFQ